MQRNSLLAIGAAVVVVVVVVFLVFRPGGDDEDAATTTASTAGPTTIAITIEGGKPVGGIHRETVQQGDDVRIVVDSDVEDEIHIHGYDLMQDIEAGEQAEIEFTADVAGSFEIELEDRGLQIAELEVRP